MKRNKKILIAYLTVLLAGGCVFVYTNTQQTYEYNYEQSETDYHSIEVDGKSYSYNTNIVSVLVMGIDKDEDSIRGRADSLFLFVLNREDDSVNIISIPRDTMTEIRLYDMEHNELGYKVQHINLQYAYGKDDKNSSMLTNVAVSKLLMNIPINYYISMDLDGITSLQDVVGDLKVVVPNDSLVEVNSNWKKGSTITLNSKNVMTYLRTRDISKDFSNNDRMERQESYINAYYEELQEQLNSNYKGTIKNIESVLDKVTTNASTDYIELFLDMIESCKYDSSNYFTLEGKNKSGVSHDEFYVDDQAKQELILELFYKED